VKPLLAILAITALAGCASKPAERGPTLSYSTLKSIKVSSANCPNIDYITNQLETQLAQRNILGKNPEDLNEADREYNSRARVIIWSLRIGCNNPDRYKS
jgi:uncharacterized lipoprotein